MDPPVHTGEALDNFRRVIGRVVVDYDQLKGGRGGVVLSQYATHCIMEQLLAVIRAHDNGELRNVWSDCSQRTAKQQRPCQPSPSGNCSTSEKKSLSDLAVLPRDFIN